MIKHVFDAETRLYLFSDTFPPESAGYVHTCDELPTEFAKVKANGGTIAESGELTGHSYVEGADSSEVEAFLEGQKLQARRRLNKKAQYVFRKNADESDSNEYIQLAHTVKGMEARGIITHNVVIVAEAALLGMTPADLTTLINTIADDQQQKIAAIEPVRIIHKAAINNATDKLGVDSALATGLLALEGLLQIE